MTMLRSAVPSCRRSAMLQRVAASTTKLASSGTSCIARRAFSSPSPPDGGNQEVHFHKVYTHPLSQMVLEHLQKVHGDWIVRKGLDRGFVLNRDGTFILHFPCLYPGDDSGRIWTSFDAAKKQHWISVYKNELLGRYPLHQGEGEWACMTEKMMMRETVDRVVERISEVDRKSEAGLA